jgi:hypothetical protein
MPWAAGGVRMADLDVMIAALQAKVTARLLSPQRLPWKLYFAWSLRLVDPMGLGLAAVISGPSRFPTSMHARHREYLRAFRRLRPHRLQPAATLSYHQVMREPLFHNHQIVGDDGAPLSGADWQPLAASGLRRVGDLRTRLAAGGLVPDPHLTALLHRLPSAWRDHLVTPESARSEWRLSADGCTVRKAGSVEQYTVLPCGRLMLAAGGDVARSGPGWTGCLVVSCPSTTRSPSLGQPVEACLFLVGPWDEVQLDPSAWGIGRASLLSYTVSEAASRLRVLRMLADPAVTFEVAHGLRPSLWQDDWSSTTEGLAGRESRWTAAVVRSAGPLDAAAGPAQPPRNVRPRLDFTTVTYHLGSPWLRLQRALPRRQPRDRALPRVQPTSTPTSAAARASDEIDAAAPRMGPAPAWRGVWGRVQDSSLPRELRSLGWRILHCALNVGAFRAYKHIQTSSQPASGAGMCSHINCDGQPETLSHAFVGCPVAEGATRWLCDVWERIEGGHRPPRSVAVLLADDPSAWRPPPSLQSLWTFLRLTTLAAIWAARSRRCRTGVAATSAGVAAATVYDVRLAMERDWQLVAVDIRQHSGVCSAWFRGRDPCLSVEDFAARWCHRGVLATAPAGGRGQPLVPPVIRLSPVWPVPLPALPPPPPPPPPLPDDLPALPSPSGRCETGRKRGAAEHDMAPSPRRARRGG